MHDGLEFHLTPRKRPHRSLLTPETKMTCVNLSEVLQRFCIWDSFPIHYHMQALRGDIWAVSLGIWGSFLTRWKNPGRSFGPSQDCLKFPLPPRIQAVPVNQQRAHPPGHTWQIQLVLLPLQGWLVLLVLK